MVGLYHFWSSVCSVGFRMALVPTKMARRTFGTSILR